MPDQIPGSNYRYVNRSVRKKDAMALVTGKPVYMDDITPSDCLVVKVLHSPHAHALVQDINTDIAMKVPGIEAIYTYKDVPDKRFTMAGQTYPEASPYDRLILDQRLRFVGDAVAIVAGENEKAVDKALKLIKVDAVMEDCDIVLEHTYHTKPDSQAMMETFRTYTCMDLYGRLHIISSTQIVFHVRRIVANALDIPKSKVRVTKPRIGGGFGAKQSCVTEVFPAFVTWKTGKAAKLIYTRQESQIAGSPRHEMEVRVKVGAMNDGTIRALDVYTLSNTGAYGEHGPTTVGLSGHKSIPLYNGNMEAYRFNYDVVYTNVQAAGAYRGYGATQGIFAVESIVSELADKLHMDPVEIREKNMVRQGQTAMAYYNEKMTACALDRCMARAKEMFHWDEKPLARDMGNGKIRAKGVAMAMQGSGISGVDVGSATLKLNDEGFYILSIGAADMGTGCDTTLAQVAAECLECDLDNIIVYGADTDSSPYDSGSYASSTMYVTGKAVEKAAVELKGHICAIAAGMMECEEAEVEFAADRVRRADGTKEVLLKDIATKSMCGNREPVQVTVTHSSPTSPPPLMVGMAELEVDKETGAVDL